MAELTLVAIILLYFLTLGSGLCGCINMIPMLLIIIAAGLVLWSLLEV